MEKISVHVSAMESLQLLDLRSSSERLRTILNSEEFYNEVIEHYSKCLQVLVLVNDWTKNGANRVSDTIVYTPEHLKNDLNMYLVDLKMHALLSECQIQLLAYFILWSCSNVDVVEINKRRCNRVPYIHSPVCVEDVRCMLYYRSQGKCFIVEMRCLLESDTLEYPGKFGRFAWYDNDPVDLYHKPINHDSVHFRRMFDWKDPKPSNVAQVLDRLTIYTAAYIPKAEITIDGYAAILIQELYRCKNVCFVQQREFCVSPLLFHMNKPKNVSSLVNGFVLLEIFEHEAVFRYFNVEEWDFSKHQLYEIFNFTKWISKEIKKQLREKEKETTRLTRRISFGSTSPKSK